MGNIDRKKQRSKGTEVKFPEALLSQCLELHALFEAHQMSNYTQTLFIHKQIYYFHIHRYTIFIYTTLGYIYYL